MVNSINILGNYRRSYNNVMETIYYVYSLLYCITRIMKSMFTVAEINDEAGTILMSLHDFPAVECTVEETASSIIH